MGNLSFFFLRVIEFENDVSSHSSSFEFSITLFAMFCIQLHVSIKSNKVRTFRNEKPRMTRAINIKKC